MLDNSKSLVMFINLGRGEHIERMIVESELAKEKFNYVMDNFIYDWISLNDTYENFNGFIEQGKCLKYVNKKQ